MSKRTEIWSCGGGVQSAAIAALVCQGKLPKPDLAVMIDTEREKTKVWDYVNGVLKPSLERVGVTLEIVPKSDFATVDIWRNDDCLMPVFTDAGNSDEPAKLPTYCSNEWKQRVMRRWANSKGVEAANIWLGISIDEAQRMSLPVGKWQHTYPLIELQMNRHDCRRVTHEMNWADAPKSSCWMCPNMSHRQWLDMKNESPDDFIRAVELEKEVRKKDPTLYFHRQGVALEDVDWSEESDLFGSCNTGYCFT